MAPRLLPRRAAACSWREPQGAGRKERCSSAPSLPLDARGSWQLDFNLGENFRRHVLCGKFTLHLAKLARRMVQAIGQGPQKLPEHLDCNLVLFAENLEKIRATNRDELRRSYRRHTGRPRDAADERH